MTGVRRKVHPGQTARSISTMTLAELAESVGKPRPTDWSADLRMDQFRFVCEYCTDMDATLAVQRSNLAGLNATRSSCATLGWKYLKDEEVKKAIGILFDGDKDNFKALRSRIIEELTKLSFYDTGDYIAIRKNTVLIHDTDQLDQRQMQAFKRVKQVKGKAPSLEVEFHDKIKAMELLDRMTGGGLAANQTNININGQGKGGIAVNITPLEAMAAGIGTERVKNGKLIDVTPSSTNGSGGSH